jgi:hypothetical protein
MEFSCYSRIVKAEEATKLANKEKERETKKLSNEVMKYAD